MSLLLERGANINFLFRRFPLRHGIGSDDFCTALHEACAFARYAEATKLINFGADVNKGASVRDTQCRSPLHAVCELPEPFHEPSRHPALSSTSAPVENKEERVELLNLMLRLGADLEATSWPERESPLHVAARYRDVAALQALLVEGADVKSQK